MSRDDEYEAWLAEVAEDSAKAHEDRGLRALQTLAREVERQALSRRLGAERKARSGPPSGTGLTVAQIVDALVAWEGEWPPTQGALTDALNGCATRTIRAALHKGSTTWQAVMAEAEGRRQSSA